MNQAACGGRGGSAQGALLGKWSRLNLSENAGEFQRILFETAWRMSSVDLYSGKTQIRERGHDISGGLVSLIWLLLQASQRNRIQLSRR